MHLDFFNPFTDRFVLLYVVEHDKSQNVISEEVAHEQLICQVDGLKERFRDLGSNADPFIESICKRGVIHEVVNKTCIELSANFIVTGTKSCRSSIESASGFLTSKLINVLKTPLLVIPEGIKFWVPINLVLAIDLKHTPSTELLKPVFDLIKILDCELFVVHTSTPGNLDNDNYDVEIKNLDQLFKSITFSCHIISGTEIVGELCDFCNVREPQILIFISGPGDVLNKLTSQNNIQEAVHRTRNPLLILF